MLSDFPCFRISDFDVQHVSTGSGGGRGADNDVPWHRLTVVPDPNRARSHGFRAWASVVAALLLLRLEGVSLPTSLATGGFL